MSCLSTRELALLVGGQLVGDGTRLVSDVGGILEAGESHVTFLDASADGARHSSQAGAVILTAAHAEKLRDQFAGDLIVAADPLEAFITAMLHFRPEAPVTEVGVSPRAHVSSTALLGKDCCVAPGATIGEHVVLGDRCRIHAGAVIGAGCQFGDDVEIFPNAVIYPGVRIGHRVRIHATAVIGADGFGYRFREGRFVKIPHCGTVVIEDDVEIGAGTTVDRAMIGATVIGAGTKLDNLVMIAHNCRIGRHNAFASQVGLAGSVTTGDYVRCGGQAGVADHALIGKGASIGGKAGVHGRVPDGAEYHGYPAGPARDQYRIAMAVQHAPEMRKQIRALEQQVKQLQVALAASAAPQPLQPAA